MEDYLKNWTFVKYPKFPKPELLASIVAGELEKPQDKKQRTLASWCVQKMLKTACPDDTKEGIYYKLIYLEPLDIAEVCQFLRTCDNLPTDRIDWSIKDPFLMQKLLEQNLRPYQNEAFRIHIQENSLSLYLDGHILLELQQEKKWDYHWAIILGKIALKKGIEQIDILSMEYNGWEREDKMAWIKEFAKNFPVIDKNHPKYNEAVYQGKTEYTFSWFAALQFYVDEWDMYLIMPPGVDAEDSKVIYWQEE